VKNIVYIFVFLSFGVVAQTPTSGSISCDTIPIRVCAKKFSPSYQLLGNDTINRVDKDSLKQGIWIEYEDSGFGTNHFGTVATSWYKNGMLVRRNLFNSQVSYTENYNSEGLKHGYDSRVEDIFGDGMYENGKPKKARPCMHFSQTREFEYYLNGVPKNRAHSWVSGCIDTIENVLNFTLFKYSDSIGCYNRPNIIESIYYYQGKLEGKYFYVDEETGEDIKIEHYSRGELIKTELFLRVPKIDSVFKLYTPVLDTLKNLITNNYNKENVKKAQERMFEMNENLFNSLSYVCRHKYSRKLLNEKEDISEILNSFLYGDGNYIPKPALQAILNSFENTYKNLKKELIEFYTIKDNNVKD
jgi:hypothetical protein